MKIDKAMADHLLMTTRGVRRRIDFDKPVDISIIDECIEIAIQAPVGYPDKGGHFIVIDEPAMRHGVSEVYGKAVGPFLDEHEALELEAADPSEHDKIRKIYSTHRWYTDNLHRVPIFVIVAMLGRYENEPVVLQAGRYGNIFPAAWSFMLALRVRGLGACWTSLHIEHEEETAALLGIPKNVTQAALLPIGYYKGSDFKPAIRPPARQYIHYNGWAQ